MRKGQVRRMVFLAIKKFVADAEQLLRLLYSNSLYRNQARCAEELLKELNIKAKM